MSRSNSEQNSDASASALNERRDRVFKDASLGVSWSTSDFVSSQVTTDNTCMSEEKVAKVWEGAIRGWGMPANEENKKLFKRECLLFLALNSASSKLASENFAVNGKEYHLNVLIGQCGAHEGTLRQFCTAQGEFTSQLLAHNPEKADACAKRNGFPPHLAIWAFDFNTKCRDYNPDSEIGRYSELRKRQKIADGTSNDFLDNTQRNSVPAVRQAPAGRYA